MISKHVHYEAAHDDYGALARYIADAGHEGEKCLASWCAGCAADDDYDLAIVEAQAVQSMNTRSQKEKTYHLLVSFRPEDEAKLTPKRSRLSRNALPPLSDSPNISDIAGYTRIPTISIFT